MNYKELSINEKINVKSWLQYEQDKGLKLYNLKLLPFIFLWTKNFDLPYFPKDKAKYQCTKETRLFRKHWKPVPFRWLASPHSTIFAWINRPIF